MPLESIEEGFIRWRDRALEAELENKRLQAEIQRLSEASPQHDEGVTTPHYPRRPAYDAVFAYIRQQPRDFLPTTVVGRNAMIWDAVHAALDAVGIPRMERKTPGD
jgi:hypothetical protein